MDKIIKALAKSRPFHNLSEETLKEITPLLKGNVKFFEKGALLLDEGEYVDYIGIVLSGKLAVSNFYSTGDENLVNILEPSYSFGLEITCTYEKLSPFSIYALTDSEVFIFNQNAIFKKGTIPEEYRSIILQDVLKFVANENMRKYHKIKIISHYKLRQKIIAYLLFEKQKNKSDTNKNPRNRCRHSAFQGFFTHKSYY